MFSLYEVMRLIFLVNLFLVKHSLGIKIYPQERSTTSNGLSAAFLTPFHPGSNSYGARCMITNFKNQPSESLVNGYIVFKGFIDHCPHHGLPSWSVLHTFYGGLS
jgi:hypothetical protein